ncbi:MAG: YbaL family putative K(+) efflux transporter [Parvibaculaceae bacterium]|nr:YbaL family putative K(+) efflux transporter [Parvibaculaceae bacterium]
MHQETPLIATLVGGFCLAFVLGAIATRLRISPLVGYLLAGVLAGPFTPGFIADQEMANELAEVGIILLMFGVGLHFSLEDLLSVRAIAIPGAIVQIGFATLLGMGFGWLMGWPLAEGTVFGLALSVASTVVLLRTLQERRLLQTERGRIAVGWLIVEDLAMVLALVLLPALADLIKTNAGAASGVAGPDLEEIGMTMLITLGKVAAFVAVMLLFGRKLVPRLLHYIAHIGSRELFRLGVLAIALGIAFGAAKLFDVSFALGAFFAGMVLAGSQLSHRAAEETLPLRDAFAVLFFVSVGMLFDPSILIRAPLPVLGTCIIIILGKSLAAFGIVRAFGKPESTALMISASLAQIGEFSFILAALGVSLGLMSEQARDLVLAGSMISILVNPAAFYAVDKWLPKLLKSQSSDELPDTEAESATLEPLVQTSLADHVVLVGYGRVGQVIAEKLKDDDEPILVIEERKKIAAEAAFAGFETMNNHAGEPGVLTAANIDRARTLFVAIPNGFEAGQIVATARTENPGLRIIARAHSDEELDYLRKNGADFVLMGEREIAMGMVQGSFGDETFTPPADGFQPV